MTGLLLVGASGLAREVIADLGPDRSVVGILDDDTALHGGQLAGVPIIGGIDLAPLHDDAILICIGSGRGRERVSEHLAALGVGEDRFATFISSAARVPAGNLVGAGSILMAGVVLTANVTVGRHVVVMPNVTLTHDNVVGDCVTIAAGVSLGGSVVLEAASYIGMNASIRQNLRVGRGATVGMGAVVLRDVPPGETWLNVPARPWSPGKPDARTLERTLNGGGGALS